MGVIVARSTSAVVSIPYDEMDGSPEEVMGEDGLHVTRRLSCAWTSRFALMQQLIGMVSVVGQDSVLYTDPHAYPDTPTGYQSPLVNSVRILPLPGVKTVSQSVGGVNVYSRAVLEVQYAPPKWNSGGTQGTDSEVLIEESLRPDFEFITLPWRQYYWDIIDEDPTSMVDPDNAPGKLICRQIWDVTFHRVPVIPSAFFTMGGYVNNAAIRSLHFKQTFAAGTLLFKPGQVSRSYFLTDSTKLQTGSWSAYSVQMQFVYNPTGWNNFYGCPGSSVPLPIYNAAGVQEKPYTEGSFLSLNLQQA